MAGTTPVSAVMTGEVVTLRPDQPIDEAADVLAEHRIGAAPVVDDDGKLVGLLRDEDLLVSEARLHLPTTIALLPGIDFTLPSALARFDHDLKKAVGSTVGERMSTEFATVGPDDTIEQLATLMHETGVTHVPVVVEGKVVGIVARGDLVQFLASST